MPRGGSRKGAGRKVGAANRRTRQIADEAMKHGMSPLEVMLDNMRFAHAGATNCLEKLIEKHDANPIEMFDAYKEMLKLRAMAQEAAKDAAPYMHPRLAAIEHTGADGGPIQLVTKAQRDAAVAAALRADS